MLVVSESKFNQMVEKNERVLTNSYVYSLSKNLQLKDSEGDEVSDNKLLASLVPSDELIKAYTSGEITQKKFLREYKKSLKTYQNQFLLYMIARSFNEKKYLPIFVCTDQEYELGYAKVFAKVLKKKFGMKQIKPKEYLKAVKECYKQAKEAKKKKKKREKAFERLLREFVEDNLQMSLEGLEYLYKLEQKFAIDRVAILINQSTDPLEEISKKDIARSIELFMDSSKKARRLVKEVAKELDISKKPERWSKRDMIKLVAEVYNQIHSDEEDDDRDDE